MPKRKSDGKGGPPKKKSKAQLAEMADDLTKAAYSGDLERVTALVDITTECLDVPNYRKQTAIYTAASRGHDAIVSFLIAQGAKVNARGNGSSPLHGAAFQGHASTVDLLLAAGADVQAANKYDLTALAEAKSEGHADVVEVFEKFANGAKKKKNEKKSVAGKKGKKENEPSVDVDSGKMCAYDDLVITSCKEYCTAADGASAIHCKRFYTMAKFHLNEAGDDEIKTMMECVEEECGFSCLAEFKPEHIFSPLLWECVSLGDQGYCVVTMEIHGTEYHVMYIISSNPMGAVFRNDELEKCAPLYDGAVGGYGHDEGNLPRQLLEALQALSNEGGEGNSLAKMRKKGLIDDSYTTLMTDSMGG